jgi:hypothetical protein
MGEECLHNWWQRRSVLGTGRRVCLHDPAAATETEQDGVLIAIDKAPN